MNLSSIFGASGTQALDLQKLLGSGNKSASTLGSDGSGGTDSVTLSFLSRMFAQTQGPATFQVDFKNLGSLISSGDLEGARKVYAAMQQKMGTHGPEGGDPLADGYSALGKALESSDTTAAKSAWDSLNTQMQSLMGGNSPGGATPAPGRFAQDMDTLGRLLASGDLTGAQELFKTMQDRMALHQKAHHPSSQSLASSFDTLGKALESGDTAGAKSAWEALKAGLENLQSSAPPNSGSPVASLLAAYQTQFRNQG